MCRYGREDRKWIALLLALAMIITAVPTAAFLPGAGNTALAAEMSETVDAGETMGYDVAQEESVSVEAESTEPEKSGIDGTESSESEQNGMGEVETAAPEKDGTVRTESAETETPETDMEGTVVSSGDAGTGNIEAENSNAEQLGDGEDAGEGAQVPELTAEGKIIASGEVNLNGHLTWKIDANGKLTVEGTGEFYGSQSLNRTPWAFHNDTITSAVVKVTGMTYASSVLTC